VVTRDVADYEIVVGNPARAIGWVGRAGERLDDDLVCPETGERYEKMETGLMLKDDQKDTREES
jgi:UDP-2-acetamido-3-amino-2,3-dideoxy-glucuronate N-acetyltransferase